MRYTVPLLKGVTFLRRPVSALPDEVLICFVDDGTSTGWRGAQSVGVFKNGEWTNGKGKPVKFEPTYWTVMT